MWWRTFFVRSFWNENTKVAGFFLFRTKGRKNIQASNLFLAVIFYVCPLYLIFCSRFKKWLYKYEFMKLFFYFSSSFFFSILTFRSLNAIGHKMHIITITRRYILELKTVLVFYVRFVHSLWIVWLMPTFQDDSRQCMYQEE